MQEINHNGHRIEYYDSMDELPITNFMKHNFYVSADAGLGSNMQDVTNKIDPLIMMIKKDTKESKTDAINALVNLKQNIAFVIQNQSPEMLSFAVMVKSINGKENKDLSDLSLNRLIKELGEIGISYSMVKNAVEFLKKNSIKKHRSSFQK